MKNTYCDAVRSIISYRKYTENKVLNALLADLRWSIFYVQRLHKVTALNPHEVIEYKANEPITIKLIEEAKLELLDLKTVLLLQGANGSTIDTSIDRCNKALKFMEVPDV